MVPVSWSCRVLSWALPCCKECSPSPACQACLRTSDCHSSPSPIWNIRYQATPATGHGSALQQCLPGPSWPVNWSLYPTGPLQIAQFASTTAGQANDEDGVDETTSRGDPGNLEHGEKEYLSGTDDSTEQNGNREMPGHVSQGILEACDRLVLEATRLFSEDKGEHAEHLLSEGVPKQRSKAHSSSNGSKGVMVLRCDEGLYRDLDRAC